MDNKKRAVSLPQPQEYGFDRYRDGKKMAEGARVHALNEEAARTKAKALFYPWDSRDRLTLRKCTCDAYEYEGMPHANNCPVRARGDLK